VFVDGVFDRAFGGRRFGSAQRCLVFDFRALSDGDFFAFFAAAGECGAQRDFGLDRLDLFATGRDGCFVQAVSAIFRLPVVDGAGFEFLFFGGGGFAFADFAFAGFGRQFFAFFVFVDGVFDRAFGGRRFGSAQRCLVFDFRALSDGDFFAFFAAAGECGRKRRFGLDREDLFGAG